MVHVYFVREDNFLSFNQIWNNRNVKQIDSPRLSTAVAIYETLGWLIKHAPAIFESSN